MSNVENLHDHQALTCECGSVKYNVLRSGKLECAQCGDHPSLPHLTDGYHSFNELYQHRHALFIALVRAMPGIAWRSSMHEDGTMFPGYFIAGLELPTGTISYHLPIEHWNDLEHANIKTMERAPKWDGHTSEDVVERLNDWNREIVSCKKCGGNMVLGKGLRNTVTGSPDFPGGEVVTVSPGGPGKMIDVLKCDECGHSVSAGQKIERKAPEMIQDIYQIAANRDNRTLEEMQSDLNDIAGICEFDYTTEELLESKRT